MKEKVHIVATENKQLKRSLDLSNREIDQLNYAVKKMENYFYTATSLLENIQLTHRAAISNLSKDKKNNLNRKLQFGNVNMKLYQILLASQQLNLKKQKTNSQHTIKEM